MTWYNLIKISSERNPAYTDIGHEYGENPIPHIMWFIDENWNLKTQEIGKYIQTHKEWFGDQGLSLQAKYSIAQGRYDTVNKIATIGYVSADAAEMPLSQTMKNIYAILREAFNNPKFMNFARSKDIIKFAGTKEEYLISLNIPGNIVQYILSVTDPKIQQYLINAVRQNPTMSIKDLKFFQKSQAQPQQTVNPYIELIQSLVNRIQHNWVSQKIKQEFHQWLTELIFKRFALRGKINIDATIAEQIESSINFNFLTLLTDWVESLEENDSIFNYTYDRAAAASTDWHERGRHSSEIYDAISEENIVHGPQWQDENGNLIPQYQGWTIQKVMSENDLEVEGDKMDHCVGGYYHKVKNEISIIYSLRDPSNEPHVTIETDGPGEFAYQIFGKKNSEPKPEYKAMIKNWIEIGENAPHSFGEEDGPLENLAYSRWTRGFEEELEKAVGEQIDGEDEYGFKFNPVSIGTIEYIFDQSYDAVAAYNDRGDYYGDRGISDSLVSLAISGGADTLEYLTELIQEKEEKAQEFYMGMDIGIPYPQEEDFEDEDEYEKAIEDYQKQEQDIIDESFPMGWFSDIYTEINKQLKDIHQTTLQDFLAKKVASAKNWYKNIKV